MTKKFICLALIVNLLCLSSVYKVYSQDPLDNDTSISTINAEKIYIQLSGTSFNTSETIWFKAIVTDALNHLPATKSGVLHVELIDPLENQIVDENLLKISGGVSHGFFQLHSRYREGKYIIRAYTEWNKNFGSDFISSIPIHVYQLQSKEKKPNPIKDIVFTKELNSNTFSLSSNINVGELDSLHKGDAKLYVSWKNGKDSIPITPKKKEPTVRVQHKVPLNVPILQYRLKTKHETFTKSIVLNKEYGSLQFFPEGGSLVEGLQSVVGFKYLNYKGKGAEIYGTIRDENNVVLSEFKSNALGMGKLTLIPEAGKRYYGVLMTKNGNTFEYELPKAKKLGHVLRLVHKGANKELRIWNKEKNRDSLFIRFFHRGKSLFLLKGKYKNGAFLFKFKDEDVPRGVIGLTVFNKEFKPIAERHFFNERKEENLDLKAEIGNDIYFARDSVQVSISSKLNGLPVQASVSVMAVDSSYFYGTNMDRNNIVSYFLLQSDIKGRVENPSYYFQDNKNLADLDYLMLTQGWTNYKYKEYKPTEFVDPEIGLEVKGYIEDRQGNRTDTQIGNTTYDLNMLVMEDPITIYTTETDSKGSFRFLLEDSYGLGRKFAIQPSDVSNKRGDLKVNITEYQIPDIDYKVEDIIVPVDSVIEKRITKKIEEDIRLDPFLLPNTIALDEVEVSDYKLTPERAEMVELHGMPDLVISGDEMVKKQKNWTKTLYRWLLFNYPNDLRVGRVGNSGGFELAYVHGAEFTYVVIDGIPVHIRDYQLIGSVPVSAVESVEIIRNTNTANNYFNDVFDCAPVCPPPAFPAIIAIYTYAGKGLYGTFSKSKKTNLLIDTAPQFTPIREFYVPEYHEPSKIDWDVPDRRTLLHWKPDIVTNREGKTETTFFNSDLTGNMVIICEGISPTGKVGYTQIIYRVNNY
jgi:hypothetical protein|tara:strand:- start:1204 stop:3954 length:2751 start_codon:yes stop_codon:yes gene_type:complete